MAGMNFSQWWSQRWALCGWLEFDAARSNADADASKVNAGSNAKNLEKCTIYYSFVVVSTLMKKSLPVNSATTNIA